MPQRLRYPELAPEGFAALSAFGHYIHTGTALEPVLLTLVELLASHLNGCEFCVAMHAAELRKHHEPVARIAAVAAWQSSDAFTPRECAAFAWTETLTHLHSESSASDEDYAAVNEFFSGKDLVDLSFCIAAINAWNRMGIAFRPRFHAEHNDGASKPAVPRGEQTQSAVADDGGKVAQD